MVTDDKFDPSIQYGYALYIMPAGFNDKTVRQAKQYMRATSLKWIPRKYRNRVKWIVRAPNPSERDIRISCGSVAWKYTP